MPIIQPPDLKIWQGDVFAGVPWSIVKFLHFVQPEGNNQRFISITPPLPGNRSRLVTHAGCDLGMLLSHECVVDKGGHAPLTFARILPITSYGEEGREIIRQGANYQTFHLPAAEGLIDESYVDFRFVAAINPQLLEQFMRVASLTSEGRDSLRLQLILYLTRHEPLVSGPTQLELPQ